MAAYTFILTVFTDGDPIGLRDDRLIAEAIRAGFPKTYGDGPAYPAITAAYVEPARVHTDAPRSWIGTGPK